MQSKKRTMKFRTHHKQKENNVKFEGLGSSGKGNPFTTPPGYFDSMSSDIMKTVGTVSILALLRTKPLQVAVGVVTTIAVATAIYFFASDNSDKKDNNATPHSSYVMPEVIMDETADQPISIISESGQEERNVVVIDPDANPNNILRWLNQLPVDNRMKNYLSDEYVIQIAGYKHSSNESDLFSDPITNDISLDGGEHDNLIPVNNDGSNSGAATQTLSAFDMLPRDTCSEQSMTLRAYVPGNNSYKWNTGATTPEISIDKSGVYRIIIALENGKLLSKSVSVKIIPKPTLNNDYLITACTGSIIRLSVAQKNSGYQYYWPQYKLSTQQLTVSKPGLYYAQVSGCQTYVDSFFVVFTHCELGIPNMITPNGDGISETFSITNLSKYPNTELSIYDKSNKLVYKSENYQNDWDASSTSDGTYFYSLRFTDGSTQEGLITVKH